MHKMVQSTKKFEWLRDNVGFLLKETLFICMQQCRRIGILLLVHCAVSFMRMIRYYHLKKYIMQESDNWA